MPKKDNIRVIIHENYSKPPMRNYPNNEIFYNQVDEL